MKAILLTAIAFSFQAQANVVFDCVDYLGTFQVAQDGSGKLVGTYRQPRKPVEKLSCVKVSSAPRYVCTHKDYIAELSGDDYRGLKVNFFLKDYYPDNGFMYGLVCEAD